MADINLFKDAKEKELVWISKDLLAKIEEIDDSAIKEELILSYVKKAKKEIETEIESYDEEVLSFKAASAKIKKVYGETLDKFLEDSYEIWKEFDKRQPSLFKKTEQIVSTLDPLEQKLTKIDNLLSAIDSKLNYLRLNKIEEVLEIIKKLESLGDLEKTIIASVLTQENL
jgi:hypothetical protein